MKQASRTFASGGLPRALQPILPQGASLQLRQVAAVFVALQDARHGADYDVTQTLTRRDTQELVVQVEKTFQSWQTVREEPEARIFLAGLLLWRQWSRRGW
jgi:hypothetical protein